MYALIFQLFFFFFREPKRKLAFIVNGFSLFFPSIFWRLLTEGRKKSSGNLFFFQKRYTITNPPLSFDHHPPLYLFLHLILRQVSHCRRQCLEEGQFHLKKEMVGGLVVVKRFSSFYTRKYCRTFSLCRIGGLTFWSNSSLRSCPFFRHWCRLIESNRTIEWVAWILTH